MDGHGLEPTDPVLGDTPGLPLGEVLQPRSEFGAYRIVRLLGQGGMGRVYEAYDPRLDRTVALKLLRRDALGAPDDLRPILMREALALAKLSSPALITVYEVGDSDGEPFIATELVDGGTLRQWLRERPRTAREILDLFIQAGHGLAEAHRAGLVHRDFKPDNVLVDKRGRARLADFGLAARAGDDTEAAAGTPAYMAPEQHDGAPADARGDQYAFCVALHEALGGARPFRGETVGEVRRAKRERPGPPPARAGLDGEMRAAIARGLEPDPARRHASMDALLAILARDPAARRRRLLALAATALIAAAAAVVATRAAAPAEACRAAPSRAWDEGARARLAQAFAAGGRPYAAATTSRVVARLDAYFAALAATRRTVCEATERRREQSPALLDLRMRCLDELELRAGALVATLTDRPDGAVVDRAPAAVAGLGDVATCARLDQLEAAPPPPSDPGLRARVAAVDREVARADALILSGQPRPAVALAEAAAAAARGLGYPSLTARAVFELGAARLQLSQTAPAEAAFREALALAAELHDDALAARAWLSIFGTYVASGRDAEADKLAFFVDAAVSRDGNRPLVRGQLLDQRSRCAMDLGHNDEAQRLAGQAVAVLEQTGGPGEFRLRAALNQLANVAKERQQLELAAQTTERLLAMTEAIDGPDHPNTAAILSNLGGDLCDLYQTEPGTAMRLRSLAIRERAYGPDSDDVAISLNGLGFCADVAEKFDDAERWYARALALEEKLHGRDTRQSFNSLLNAGASSREAGRYDLARERIARALAIAERDLGAEHPHTGYALQELGLLEIVLGRFATAVPPLRRSLAILERAEPGGLGGEASRSRLGLALCFSGHRDEGLDLLLAAAAAHQRLRPDSFEAMTARTDLGECQLALGRPVAIPDLERQLSRHEKEPGTWLVSRLRFVLARARWAANDDRPRALALATAARDALRRLAPGAAWDLAAVDAWLRTHG